jgi:hypothetical protein
MPYQLIAQIIICIIILIVTIYTIQLIYSNTENTDLAPKMVQLNKKNAILQSDIVQSTLLGTPGASVMGFFNLSNGDRTVKYNTYTPLMYIDNNWYLEISPAPVGKVATRLRIQTNNGGRLHYEIIELPQIPKQKWVFIAILRDGRRFDIIYDNMIVASQRLENYPVVISNELAIGNKGLSGSAIHFITTGSRLSPNSVESIRVQYVDTNNMIIEANSLDISFPAIKLFAQCPPGLACDPVTAPPRNNLLQWKSPYA